MSGSSARWVFTFHLNEEEGEHLDHKEFMGELWSGCKFAIYQLERADSTGQLHYQGYIVLLRSQRFNWVKKLFSRNLGRDTVHVEQARGNHGECIDYCSKEQTRVDGPWEFGSRAVVGQGKRSDLEIVREKLDSGTSVNQIAREHFSAWVKYRGAFADYAALLRSRVAAAKYQLKDFTEPALNLVASPVWLIWGDTGCGKTAWALAHFKNPCLCRHLEDLRSYDPEVHDGIVFDDLGFMHVPFQQVLNLVDFEYETTVHARYQNIKIPAGTPRLFTYNEPFALTPKDATEQQIKAIERRVSVKHISVDIRVFIIVPDSDPDTENDQ